jgi:hypothetical protein
MKSLRKLRPGEVHFAHLHLAHYPYILDANCVIKPEVHTWLNRAPFEVEGPQGEQNTTASRADRYSQYFAQFECTQSIIEQLFSAIKSGGAWEQSIIIVHGDHGSRIVRHRPLEANLGTLVDDDFRDAFATFFAIKDSNSIGEIDTNTLPIQQLLARAWQLPPPVLVPNLVYVQSLNGALLPTTLKGFDSMPDIRANLKDR